MLLSLAVDCLSHRGIIVGDGEGRMTDCKVIEFSLFVPRTFPQRFRIGEGRRQKKDKRCRGKSLSHFVSAVAKYILNFVKITI